MILPLGTNDSIQVRTGPDGSSSYYESRVVEAKGGELLISWPTEAGQRMPVRELQVLSISFSRYQRVYEFEATVLDVIEAPVAVLALRPASSLHTIQRRNNVRIRALAPIELTAKVVGIERYRHGSARQHRIRGETINISAGGFSLRHHSAMPTGVLFEVKLTLPGESRKPLEMSARVVRCTPLGDPEAAAPEFDLSFSFTRIGEAARARIVRFVFGAQLEERLEE